MVSRSFRQLGAETVQPASFFSTAAPRSSRRGDDLLFGEVQADARGGEFRRQVDGDGVGRGADVGAGLICRPAGQLHQEVDGALRGDVGHLPVHAAFEALGRLGRQLVAAA